MKIKAWYIILIREMNCSLSVSLEIITGPVQSGKTTLLINRLTAYHNNDKRVLYVNSVYDTRSEGVFSTHNKEGVKSLNFPGVKVERLKECDVSKYDVIGVDEAQFFGDLRECVLEWVDSMGKIVIVSGLDGDYKREKFGQISELLSYSDSVVKLRTYCGMCKNKGRKGIGIFSKRIVNGESVVMVGGEDVYLAVCRECYKL